MGAQPEAAGQWDQADNRQHRNNDATSHSLPALLAAEHTAVTVLLALLACHRLDSQQSMASRSRPTVNRRTDSSLHIPKRRSLLAEITAPNSILSSSTMPPERQNHGYARLPMTVSRSTAKSKPCVSLCPSLLRAAGRRKHTQHCVCLVHRLRPSRWIVLEVVHPFIPQSLGRVFVLPTHDME